VASITFDNIYQINVSRARALVAAACCSSIFFAHMLVASKSIGQRIGLRFISRRSRRNRSSLYPFVSHIFSLLRYPPHHSFASRTSSRGVIHLSTWSQQPLYPAVLSAMRIRVRRPDAWRTAISLCRSALFFFSSSTLSATRVPKVGKRYRPLLVYKVGRGIY